MRPSHRPPTPTPTPTPTPYHPPHRVVDHAIQMHGGMGLCEDTFLARAYSFARTLRIADGPDEVHQMALGKLELRDTYRRLGGKKSGSGLDRRGIQGKSKL